MGINCFAIHIDGNEIAKGYGFDISLYHRRGDEKNNEVTNPKVIGSWQEREIARATLCEGFINVIFQVIFRDVDKFGLIIK